MNDLFIEASKEVFATPLIALNARTGTCKIIGESFTENPPKFYQPMFDWLATYTQEVKGKLAWDFQLEYFNSSSAKIISNLLKQLKRYEEQGGQVTVNWHYPEYNEELLEDGECFMELSQLRFNFVSYDVSNQNVQMNV